MSYGAVIAQDNVTKTFCEALRSLGLARISKLKIMKGGVNLVSTENKLGNRQTQVGNFYIYTNMSTADKKKTLEIGRAHV